MFGMPGWIEIVIIGAVILILFGKRIPETMRALGRGIMEFRKEVKGISDDDEKDKGPKGRLDEK